MLKLSRAMDPTTTSSIEPHMGYGKSAAGLAQLLAYRVV